MTTIDLNVIPEQGQIVTVRQRRYVVANVNVGNLSPSPLTRTLPTQHLITLNAIEDIGMGETLQVIWELEPGTTVNEKVALSEPLGFDTPDRLDAFLDAVRWLV